MQPTCRQVPPRYGSFSTTIVFRPNSPARIAATYPPGPLPIIATSYFATRSLPCRGGFTPPCSPDGPPGGSALSPQSHSKKLEGVRPTIRGANRPFYGRHSKRSLYERHPSRSSGKRQARRRKSRPRLQRERLHLGKH